MRNYFLCFLAISTLLSFVSCSQDDPAEEDVRKEVKVTATFKGLSVARNATTRATDNSWEEGDEIGLFMMKSGEPLDQTALAYNVKYTFDTGDTFKNTSDNKVLFPFNKENVDFISYYPFKEALNDLTYKIDVSSQTNLSDIDLLYSDNVNSVNSNHDVINLHFKHQLTKVIVSLDAGDTGNDLSSFTATITNVNKKASFQLSDGSITNESGLGDIDFYVDNEKAEAILLPNEDLSDSELVITVDGTSYSFSLTNSTEGNAFEKSQKYTYSIKLREGKGPALDGLTATIEDWTANDINDVYADEVPASEDDENSNPGEGEGSGDGEEDGGEVDNPENPEEDNNSETDLEGIAGTKENPYTIAQLLDKVYKEDKTSKDYLVYEEGVWIEGYIVGGYNSKNEFSIIDRNYNNIALADLSSEISGDKTFGVDLDKNNGCSPNFFEALKLASSDNLNKKVLLLGDIGDFKVGLADINQRPGIINLKEVFSGGVKIEK